MSVGRPHRLELRLSDAEYAALTARAQDRGSTLSDVIRRAILVPLPPSPDELPTWEGALKRLQQESSAGSVQATIALERALRPVTADAREALKPRSPAADFGLRLA